CGTPPQSHWRACREPCRCSRGKVSRLAKERDTVAVAGELDSVADGHTLAFDAGREPAAALQRDDRQLIGRIRHELLRRGVHHGLGVDDATAHMAPHPDPARIVTTAVAPDPPRFCASPNECRSSCRSPAWPRICIATSQICATPVAP